MELLKQKLYSPMTIQDMSFSLFTGSGGHLDKVPHKKIGDFEKAWIQYLNTNHKDFCNKVKDSLELSKDDMAFLEETMQTFKSEGDWHSA